MKVKISDFINNGYNVLSYTVYNNSIDSITVEKYGITIILKKEDNHITTILDYRDIHNESIIPNNDDVISILNTMLDDVINQIEESSKLYGKISHIISNIDFKDFVIRVTVGDYIKISIKREGKIHNPTKEELLDFLIKTKDTLTHIIKEIEQDTL